MKIENKKMIKIKVINKVEQPINIIDFLNKNNIKWFPINVKLYYDENNELKKKFMTFEGYECSFKDFINITDNELKKRQNFIDETDMIAIDTNYIQQIDIDNKILMNNDFIKNLLMNNAYFLSCTKRLAHIFIQCNDINKNINDRIAYKDLDVLKGQWSFCKKNENVINNHCKFNNISINIIDNEFNKKIIENEKVIKKTNNIEMDNINGLDNGVKDMNIDDLLKNIDEKYYDCYNHWINIGMALHNYYNGDIKGFELWKNYSKLINSNKYENNDWLNNGIAYKSYFTKFSNNKIIKITMNTLKSWVNNNNNDDNISYKNCKSYKELKIEFEKKYFYIKSISNYGYIDYKGELIIKKKQQIINDTENIFFKEFDKKKNEEVIKSFITRWFIDNKREYDDVVFSFDNNVPNNLYNRFNGIYVDKLNIDFDIDEYNFTIKKVLDFIDLLFNHKQDYVNYFCNWFSSKLKNLNEPSKVALLLKSTMQGTGKGLICSFLGRILGLQYFNKTEKINTIFGQFNTGMRDKLLVVLDEINAKRVKEFEENIKSLITEENITIEDKCITATNNYKNTSSFIFLTNNDFPLKLSQYDRRFAILDCIEEVQPEDYYKDYFDFFKLDKTLFYFYKYLINLDINNFKIKDFPKSNLGDDIKEASKPIIYNFIEYLSTEINYNEYDPILDYMFEKDIELDCSIIQANNLYRIYKKWLYFSYGNKIETNFTKFGLDFKKFLSYTIDKNNGLLYNKEKNIKGIVKNKKNVNKYYIDFDILKNL